VRSPAARARAVSAIPSAAPSANARRSEAIASTSHVAETGQDGRVLRHHRGRNAEPGHRWHARWNAIGVSSAIGLLAMTPACSHPGAPGRPDDAAPDGAPIDAGFDGMEIELCAGSFVRVCVALPVSPVTLTTQTINTATSALCAPYRAMPAVDACVIAGSSIAIPAGNKVSVTGAKRLILLAGTALTISGTLDAASHHGGPNGPAVDTGPCPTGFTNPTTGVQGGGGWGGSFGRPGGNGGTTSGGGAAGIAAAAPAITALGGGCSGANGANNAAGIAGGAGGRGGGAVALLANRSLTIDGMVNASGAGGNSGKIGAGGGGGGGTGGMIVLDSPIVRIPGTCFANGGGGGEGGEAARDGNGGGESAAPNLAAAGGKGGSALGGDGGNGGFGSAAAATGGNGGAGDGGGGGGGGGAGIIKILSADQQNTGDPGKVSPPPS
jgi:hypothetical protein